MIRTYSELKALQTFDERFDYLNLKGIVGVDTFGFDRVFNQMFYRSAEWKRIRDYVIIRDNACDLGVKGYEIYDHRIIVHHMNPVFIEDIEKRSEILLDPEYLITTIHPTHNAIHYGDRALLNRIPIVRSRNDTCPWRR